MMAKALNVGVVTLGHGLVIIYLMVIENLSLKEKIKLATLASLRTLGLKVLYCQGLISFYK